MKNFDGLTHCARECKDGKCCKMSECRMAERLNISFARVKQIETKAFSKLKKHLGEKPY